MDVFQDKLAVVTGGGRGIGRETALGLARMGATVACCRGTERLNTRRQAPLIAHQT